MSGDTGDFGCGYAWGTPFFGDDILRISHGMNENLRESVRMGMRRHKKRAFPMRKSPKAAASGKAEYTLSPIGKNQVVLRNRFLNAF